MGKTKQGNIDMLNETGKEAVKNGFIDRTMENWYCKSDENKVFFCDSVYDIITGKTDSFVYTKLETSVRKVKNEKGGVVERSRYVLFVLSDNSKVLVKVRGELK
jgi:hypothetical protein